MHGPNVSTMVVDYMLYRFIVNIMRGHLYLVLYAKMQFVVS